MELKRVVVTGVGAITPLGHNVADTWAAILAGKSGAAPITHFNTEKFKTHFACEVKDFDPKEFIDRKEANKMDLYTQYAVVAATECIEDSSLNLEALDLNRIGVVLGVGIGGINSFEKEVSEYARTGEEMGPRYSPFFIPKMIADIASGFISIKYGFHGPNFVTTSACASSTHALATAVDLIRLGKADAILSGGSEAAIFSISIHAANSFLVTA